MNQIMLVQGIESLLADPVARAEHLRDVAALDRLMTPLERAPSAPGWPTPAVTLPSKDKAAALLLVRSDRRGGFSFAIWHDKKLSALLDDEARRGAVQAHPLPAEIAGLPVDDVAFWAFARVEQPGGVSQ